MPSDMKTVYRARNVEEADIIVAWLEEQGVAALVKDRTVAGTLDIPVLFSPHGIEICVPEPAQAERAAELLKEHYRERGEADDTGPAVEVVCEKCGQTSSFPSSRRGMVQTCPHCNAYIDVPDESEPLEEE